MEAIQTANNMFNYTEDVFYGLPLYMWVDRVHKHNCTINGWNYYPLRKGAFGYDNLAISIGYTLKHFNSRNEGRDKDILEMAELVHKGWCINYTYWRDNKPSDKYKYFLPYEPLGDERRNLCAVTGFADLNKTEQDKDYVIAQFLYDNILW